MGCDTLLPYYWNPERDLTLPTYRLKSQWGKRISDVVLCLCAGHTALVITCIHRHLILCTYAITSFLKVIWNHSLGLGPWAWHMFFLEGVSGFPTVDLHCSRAYRHCSDGHNLMPYSHTSILLHYWVDTELVITKGHWNIHLLLHLQ